MWEEEGEKEGRREEMGKVDNSINGTISSSWYRICSDPAWLDKLGEKRETETVQKIWQFHQKLREKALKRQTRKKDDYRHLLERLELHVSIYDRYLQLFQIISTFDVW